MSASFDLIIVGAGPAGMAAAIEAAALKLKVLVIDEAASLGGQIFRAVERVGIERKRVLGPDYAAGTDLARRLRASGAEIWAGHQVWNIETGAGDALVYASDGTATRLASAPKIIAAVGAMERATPFPGWTLPGVMTVGAAQILLKSASALPGNNVWIAGQGPLPLIYAAQVVKAGGNIAGFLDLADPNARWAALPLLPAALRNWRALLKGAQAILARRRAGMTVVTGVTRLEALGQGRVERVRYEAGGAWAEVPAAGLLIHDGVVPNCHVTWSQLCDHVWDDRQRAFRPMLDAWGRTSKAHLAVAGDAGGILGAAAAEAHGAIVAIGAAFDLGRLDAAQADIRAAPHRARTVRETAMRPFLDTLYAPVPAFRTADDATIVCRCEGVSAGVIRAAVRDGALGPNQVKSFTRCGMGACQGRTCGLHLTEIIAAARGASPEAVGALRIRPPLKPLTLGELAALAPAKGAA